MDPRWLFPLLAIGFAVIAAMRCARDRRIGPAARSWLILALVFGAVSLWLHTF